MIQNNILVSNNSNNSLRFFTSLCNTEGLLQPSWGVGPATFSRASSQYITDFEGVTRKVESNCVAVEGSRVVTNLLTYSEDLSNAAWTKNMLGDWNAVTITGTNLVTSPVTGSHGIGYARNVLPNETYIFTADVKDVDHGALSILFKVGNGTSTSRTITKFITSSISTNGYTRVSASITIAASGESQLVAAIGLESTVVSKSYYVRNAQLENVTGQTNQNPGEYVRTTSSALSQCFSTTNGNTVDANGVVTEATGTSLPQSYSERANGTAYVLNDKIQVSGWWYYCTTAGTSDSSAPTFPQGKAGSQTVTDGTAVWTLGGRLLLGYVSEPASTNKVTAYGIIPADTLGSELITVENDRTFASDTGFWTRTGTTSITGGVCNIAGTTNEGISRNSVVSTGKFYTITYTVARVGSGSVFVGCGTTSGTGKGTVRTTTGTYTETLFASDDLRLRFYAGSAVTDIDIDNVSIKEVTWATGTKSFHNGSSFVQNITGLALSGDTAAVLSIVSDQTEIEKAGLEGINPGYKVYKLDNSGGSSGAYVAVAGAVGNTNAHTLSIFHRGSLATNGMSYNDGASAVNLPASSSYIRTASANVTPAASTRYISITAGIGDIIYFLLPQLEELPYATSIMPPSGATATRAATSLSYQTAGNLRGNDVTVGIDSFFNYLGSGESLFATGTGTGDWFGLWLSSTTARLRRITATVENTANKSVSLSLLVPNKIIGSLSKTAGVKVYTNGSAPTTNSVTTDGVVGTDFTVGFRNVSGATAVPVAGYLRNLRIWFKPLSDDRCKQLTL